MRTARLIAPIPPVRVQYSCGDCNAPKVGDVVQVDQGFMFPDGRPGGMVYFVDPDGRILWSADVYDSKLEVLAENDSST